MEISKTQIARLVLGYLKSENCKSAFSEFLLKSKYLKSHAVFVKNGKYFATRVGGLTLEEILSEYSDMASIIQGRLEHTDYYDKGLKFRLPEQLVYVLENDSRSSSPFISKDLNATPVESLPGNSLNDCVKSSISFVDKSAVSSSNSHQVADGNILDINNQNGKVEKTLVDLDNQIKAIKQKAEKDPVFDKLLEEIIGPRNDTSTENTTIKDHRVKIQGANDAQISETNQSCTNPLNVEITNVSTSQNVKPSTSNSQSINSTSYPDSGCSQLFITGPGGLLMVPSLVGTSNYILLNNASSNAATSSVKTPEVDANRTSMMPIILQDNFTQHSKGLQSQVVMQQPVVTQSQIIMTSQPQVILSSQKTITSTTSKTKATKTLKTLIPKIDKTTANNNDCNIVSFPDKQKGRSGVTTRSSRLTKKAETPPKKETIPVVESEKKKKSAKSLFKDTKKTKTFDSWDAELRELLIPKETEDEKMDSSDGNLEISINDEELRKEALMIEEAFKTPVKSVSTPKKQLNKEKTPEDEKMHESKEKSEETGEMVIMEKTEVHLRNCNGPSRIKKKCNVTDTSEMFEIVETVEIEEESPIKTKNEIEHKKVSLKTPEKSIPKTPGKLEMTPFSQVIEEQLAGMDLLSMPTPCVDTPAFPVTPTVRLTPDRPFNRPTDYSTSSSYYQPSDTEQSKSLEAVMEELRNEKTKDTKPSEVSEMKKMFNKNVIGKKNLNLMKKSEYSESSDSCTSGNSSDSDSDTKTTSKSKTQTPYCFRKRSNVKYEEDARKTTQNKREKAKTVQKASPKSSKKKVENKSSDMEKCENENEITDDDFALHLSTDEDSTNKVSSNEVALTKNKDQNLSPSKEDSNKLVQDLYDRGIHLLPKVQSNKMETPMVNKDPDALENLEVSSEDESEDSSAKLNVSFNPENIIFNCINYEETETINLVYDSSKRRKKKVYDLALLERKIEADVYVEALDIDMKRIISFSPTVTVLECSPKKLPVKRRRSVKQEPKTQPRTKKEDSSKTKPDKVEIVKDKNEDVETSKTVSKRSRSLSTYVENSKKVEVEKIDDGEDDDLMNFAVLGEVVEGGNGTVVEGREKRKLSSGSEIVPPEKRSKTETEKQALLKKVNVDLFLNEVHGGGEKQETKS